MGLDKYFREGYEEPKSGTANRRAQPWHVSLLLFFRQREEREKKRGNPGNSFRNITDNFILRDLPFSFKSRELLVTSNLA